MGEIHSVGVLSTSFGEIQITTRPPSRFCSVRFTLTRPPSRFPSVTFMAVAADFGWIFRDGVRGFSTEKTGRGREMKRALDGKTEKTFWFLFLPLTSITHDRR